MKKILLLSERLPFPPTSGTKNFLYNCCRILHYELGYEVINVSFLEAEDDVSQKPDFISKVIGLPDPSGKIKIKNIIIRTFLKREFPLQVSLYWDRANKAQINQIIDLENPDYVIADFIRTTEYLKDFNGFKVADLQDLLSLRYQRQLNVSINEINPYGAYLFRLPKSLQRLLQLGVLKKLVMKFEISLLKKYEMKVGEVYDRVMFVAKKECNLFDEMIGKKKSITVPLGVDYEYFSEKLDINQIDNSIAFMGALNVAHNENGIIHFIEKVFPLVLSKLPLAKLFIIGGGARDTLMRYEASNIIFTGRVPDVRAVVGACSVFICPLQFGSGIKTKNLEAMAMGVPVVTTEIGAENIDAQSGQDWCVVHDDNEFADRVTELLMNSARAKVIGSSGQSYIKEAFSWNQARSAFSELFNNDL